MPISDRKLGLNPLFNTFSSQLQNELDYILN